MKKPHYGWVICISCTLQLFVTAGVPGAAFGVHLPYIIESTGFTNTQSSLILTIRTIAILLSMLCVNRYLDKLGIRWGLLLASLIGTGGFLVYSTATSLPVYYLGAVLSGTSIGLAGMIPISILISRWFHSSRGFALSVCSAGSGLATIIIPPIVSSLITKTDLATAFRVEGLFIALSAFLVFLLLRNTPAEMDLEPYQSALSPRKETSVGPKRADLTRSGMLWLLLAMFLLGGPGCAVNFLTLLYTGSGYSEATAALLFSVFGLALTVGKFVMGFVTDKLGGYKFNVLGYGAFIAAAALSCVLFLQNSLLLLTSVICMGLGLTITTIGISYLAEDFSSEETYGRTLKKFQVINNVGIFVFTYVVGAIADLTRGYAIPFLVLAALAAVTLTIILVSYRRFRTAP